jgi:aryl-alcohol dehydrogenase-like predicted oxidoreductase
VVVAAPERELLVVFLDPFADRVERAEVERRAGDRWELAWPGCLAVSREELDDLAGLGVQVLAWSSLATGFFGGRETPHWDTPANRARRERAAELGERLESSPAAVALAYVLHQPGHVLPVVRTGSEAHLDEMLAAAEIELARDQLAWLESGR